jgi:hypothetical protein
LEDRPPSASSRPSISIGAKIGRRAEEATTCSGPMRAPRPVSNTTRSPLTTSVVAMATRISPEFSRSKSTMRRSRSSSGSRS